jgi:hypothetical protein
MGGCVMKRQVCLKPEIFDKDVQRWLCNETSCLLFQYLYR